MKSIIITSLVSLFVIVGGYAAYLKQFVKQAKTEAVTEAATYTEDDVHAIEFAMRALEEQKRDIVELETGYKSIRGNIAAEKAGLAAEQEKLRSLLEEVTSSRRELAENQEQALTRLAKLYESMKPKEAAEIAAKLSVDLLVEILPRMKNRAAAKLIASMDTSKAVLVTQKLGSVGGMR